MPNIFLTSSSGTKEHSFFYFTMTNIHSRYFNNMAPNLFGNSATLFLEASQQNVSQKKNATEKTTTQNLPLQMIQNSKSKYQWKIVWRNVIAFLYLHFGALYGLYILIVAANVYTLLWGTFYLHIF